MEKESIKEYVLTSLCEILGDSKLSTEVNCSVHLMGAENKIFARELAFLIIKLQNHYGVIVSEDSIVSGKLSTIDGIVDELILRLKDKVKAE